MPERFSRLREANRLSNAYTQYRAWEDARRNRVPNVGGGTPRPPTIEIALTPFGFEMPTASAVRATCTESARDRMATAIGTHGPLPTGGISLQRIPGFKAARISLFVGSGGSQREVSQITGLPYLKYAGNSFSHPFGAATATDLEYDVFTSIRAALIGANKRVSYKAEQRQIIV